MLATIEGRQKLRQRRKEGSFVKIPLGQGKFGYGRVLEEPLFAFYSIVSETCIDLDKIVSSPILFKINVMNYAITKGVWEIIGFKPLESQLQERVNFFRVDALSGELFVYTYDRERPATHSECIGMERLAVWDPEHVEDRLRDHIAGLPNKWVESLKLPAAKEIL